MIDAITTPEVVWLGILTYVLFAMACIGLWRMGSAAKEREQRERKKDGIETEFERKIREGEEAASKDAANPDRPKDVRRPGSWRS